MCSSDLTVVWNNPAISVAVIHTSLPVTLTALSSMMIVSLEDIESVAKILAKYIEDGGAF